MLDEHYTSLTHLGVQHGNAANFQNELLQIKTSKVCVHTEGRKSGY